MKDPITTTITGTLLWVDDWRTSQLPIRIELSWRRDDPLTVMVRLSRERIPWALSRELLATGLNAPSGQGDVMVLPVTTHRVELVLRSPDGEAVIALRTRDVRAFLRATARAVPLDAAPEVDDAALRELLEEGST